MSQPLVIMSWGNMPWPSLSCCPSMGQMDVHRIGRSQDSQTSFQQDDPWCRAVQPFTLLTMCMTAVHPNCKFVDFILHMPFQEKPEYTGSTVLEIVTKLITVAVIKICYRLPKSQLQRTPVAHCQLPSLHLWPRPHCIQAPILPEHRLCGAQT